MAEVQLNWPKVIVYDVDRDIESSNLLANVGEQNTEVNLVKGIEREGIMPLFRKGIKGGTLTN